MSAAGTELMLPALRTAFRRAAGSFSSVRARPITGSHLFQIDGYKLLHRMVPSDGAVESNKFHIGGLDWQVSYYPKGFDKKSRFVGVGLRATGKDSSGVVAAASQVSIVDRAGAPAFTRHIQPEDLAGRGLQTLGWGYSMYFSYTGDFVDKEELSKWVQHHMDDDRLYIRCDVVVLQTNTESRLGRYLKDFWRFPLT
jgi:hypothetical protein